MLKPVSANPDWLRRLHDKQERAEQQEVVTYARQVRTQTGCTWGEAIAVAERRIEADKQS